MASFNHEFAIKVNKLKSGKEVYIPVYRTKSTFSKLFANNKWTRIVKLYNKYTLMELDFEPELTHEQCEEHIKGFAQALINRESDQICKIEILPVNNLV